MFDDLIARVKELKDNNAVPTIAASIAGLADKVKKSIMEMDNANAIEIRL